MDKVTCAAINKNGTLCKRTKFVGNTGLCYQHQHFFDAITLESLRQMAAYVRAYWVEATDDE